MQVILVVAYVCVHCTWYNNIQAYSYYEGVTLGYSVAIVMFSFLTVFGAPKKIQFLKWETVVSIIHMNTLSDLVVCSEEKNSPEKNSPSLFVLKGVCAGCIGIHLCRHWFHYSSCKILWSPCSGCCFGKCFICRSAFWNF